MDQVLASSHGESKEAAASCASVLLHPWTIAKMESV